MINPFRPLALATLIVPIGIVTVGINASSHVREPARSEISTFAYRSAPTPPGAVAGASDCSDPVSPDVTERHRTGAPPNVGQTVTGAERISAPCAGTPDQTPGRAATPLAIRRDIALQTATSYDCRRCDGMARIIAGPTDLGRLVARFAPSLPENRVTRPGVGDEWAIPQNAAATIRQGFDPPWSDKLSPDGLWRINGFWTGSGGNVLDPSLARIASRSNSVADASLLLTVAANEKRGSEIQTLQGYGYGYYETRMQVTSVPGVVASFFWIEAPKYGPHEWDIEFLTNESWIASANAGQVHLTLHPSNTNVTLPLPFNPSKAFHTYGFLWTAGRIVFTVDGKAVHTFTAADLRTTAAGFIMVNTWTGNPNWGGGPPVRPATTAYSWVQFTAGATDIPAP